MVLCLLLLFPLYCTTFSRQVQKYIIVQHTVHHIILPSLPREVISVANYYNFYFMNVRFNRIYVSCINFLNYVVVALYETLGRLTFSQ
jgi:hypothetical protein